MKQIKLAVIALFTFAISNVSAQDADNPWAVSFGINTVDVRHYTKDFGTNLEDFIGSKEWGGNTLPSISRISADKYLKDGFTLQLAGSLNKLSTIVSKNDSDALYYSIDVLVKYDLNNLFGETTWFDPYVALGGAYQSLDSEGDGVLNGGLGFNTWFNENLGLNFQTVYKHGFESTGRDVFQHSLGLVFKFGGKDTDGDGVYDKDDACPEVAGLKEFNGCPDTDKDGVIDMMDQEVASVEGALVDTRGVALDSDKDGVLDHMDEEPYSMPGYKVNAKGLENAIWQTFMALQSKVMTLGERQKTMQDAYNNLKSSNSELNQMKEELRKKYESKQDVDKSLKTLAEWF